jgi:hypothetical protein
MDKVWPPVREWHRAVNAKDMTGARDIVTDDIEMGGPKGSARGAEAFLAWAASANINLFPVAWHPVSDERVIVEQMASWAGDPNAVAVPPVRVATVFRLRGERVESAMRFDTLRDAMDFVEAGAGRSVS